MKKKTAPTQSWLDAVREQNRESSGEQTALLALRGTLDPGSSQYSARLQKLLTKSGSGAGRAAIAGFLTDLRQPAWARLAAALVVGDRQRILELESATLRLSEHPEIEIRHLVGTNALTALGPLRRLCLHAAGMLPTMRHLTPTELPQLIEIGATTSWWKRVEGLGTQVRWNELEYPQAIEVLEKVQEQGILPAKEQLHLLVEAGNDLGVLATLWKGMHLERLLSHHTQQLRTALPILRGRDLLVELCTGHGTPGKRLAGNIVAAGKIKELYLEEVRLLAAHPESSWALPRALSGADGEKVVAALEETLKWSRGENVPELLAHLSSAPGESWWKQTGSLRSRNATIRWEIARAAAEKLAGKDGVQHAAAIPSSILADVVRYGKDQPHLDAETLDRARAVLVSAEQSAPRGEGAVHGKETEKALQDLLLAEARHDAGRPGGKDTFRVCYTWLAHLSAESTMQLTRKLQEQLLHCHGEAELPRSLTTTFEDALSAAGSIPARAALLQGLTEGNESAAPSDQTLRQYARNLAQIVAHQGAA